MEVGTKLVDNRNIIDYYKYWTTDAIKADLDTKRLNYSVLCCNINGDLNIGSVIRNSNAFLAKEVIIYGRKKYDRRGAVGVQNYLNFKHVKELTDIKEYIQKNHCIAIDNVDNSLNINDFVWPNYHFTMIFGAEGVGIPKEILDMILYKVYIPQLGSVRSLNVGCASAIAMNDYIRKL